MYLRIPPLEIKITLESNPQKSTMLVGGLGMTLIDWQIARVQQVGMDNDNDDKNTNARNNSNANNISGNDNTNNNSNNKNILILTMILIIVIK